MIELDSPDLGIIGRAIARPITPASPDAVRGVAFAVFSFRKRHDAYGSPRASYCYVLFLFKE
jgi:hypothetical protein